MSVTPIKSGTLHFKKSNLLDKRLLIGIDSGTSMTKVMFLHKDSKSQFLDDKNDFVTLNHALFKNEDFSDAMKWTREHAYLPEGTGDCVHVTGNCTSHKMEIVESIFGLKTEQIDERLTIIAGHRIALEQIGLEQLIASPVEVQGHGQIESKMMEKFMDAFAAKFSKEALSSDDSKSKIFPCLVNVYNSESEFYFFDEEGRGETMAYPQLGGATFLGLAKCLLDTNIYDNIMKLASVGDRSNVDTQVKEIMVDDVNSPYGQFPPDMPMFSFGKSMDLNKGLEDYNREDVAMSLIGLLVLFLIIQSGQICPLKGIPKLYLTGNIFRSDEIQKELTRSMMVFPFAIEVAILDFAYYGALGAMLCNNSDKEKYCRN